MVSGRQASSHVDGAAADGRRSQSWQSSLLRETFIHIAGIGPKTERRLWQSGISNWDELRTTSFGLRSDVLSALEDSDQALIAEDVDYFFSALPPRERWRAFADFGSEFVAVDIETTGMSIYDQITVVGIESAGEYRTFVAGSNLAEAAELIHDAPGLLSFNGSLFDLPFIQRTFPTIRLPRAHVDLRFLARRVGWRGSLKVVEQLSNLHRTQDLADISGYGATVLWSQFDGERDLNALEQLVLYNAADTCVLRPLAELVTERLRTRLEAVRGEDMALAPSLFSELRTHAPVDQRLPSRHVVAPLPKVTCSPRGLKVGAVTVRLPAPVERGPAANLAALATRMPDPGARIVGIDLTGSELRPSGWALLEGSLVTTGLAYSDDELLAKTINCRPRVVSIDSPLSIPAGRHCTNDACECRATGGITRHCERELKRRGINVYPCLIQSMQALTQRGMRIAEALRDVGIEVIESYPGAAQDMMRIPRKRASQEQLRAGLTRFGLRGVRAPSLVTHDELDAVTSAVVGVFYLAQEYEGIGTPDEGYLIVPRLSNTAQRVPEPDFPLPPIVPVLVGHQAAALCDRLGYEHLDEYKQLPGADPELVVTVETIDDFCALLSDAGPRVRGFHVAQEGTRLRRRPSLVDEHRRADADDLESAISGWLSDWRGDHGCP